jgi:TolB protein
MTRSFVPATLVVALLTGLLAPRVLAQDTTKAIDQGVRVGLDYQPGTQPGLVVLPATGLDSARAIVERDLDFSDRFQIVTIGSDAAGPGGRGGSEGGGISYGIYKALGAEFGVELTSAAAGAVTVRLHDLTAGKVRNQQTFALPPVTDPAYRIEVHRIADEVARWATGTDGIAASRLLFVSGGRVYQMDSDGEGIMGLTPAGQTSLSPVWSPDGQRFAYTVLAAGRGGIMVQTLASGASLQVPGTNTGLNITPAFSPDGRLLAYAHPTRPERTFLANVADAAARSMTVGRYAETYLAFSPDGRRAAFVSTRAGPPQVFTSWRIDGTDQELLAPFDYGHGSSSEWSDGANVVFHRGVSGPQLFLVDVAGRRVPAHVVGPERDRPGLPDGVISPSSLTGAAPVSSGSSTSGIRPRASSGRLAPAPAWSPSEWTAVAPNPNVES